MNENNCTNSVHIWVGWAEDEDIVDGVKCKCAKATYGKSYPIAELKKQGWVQIPGSQNKNVTIFTHDSAEERFMTWDDWETEAVKLGWKKG